MKSMLRFSSRVTLAALLLAGVFALCASHARAEEQSRTIERRFDVPAAAELEIDNVNGPIHVVAHSGRTIEMSARETVRGDSASDVERARREVKLDITQESNRVRLYVDGPFRCNCDENGRRGRRSVHSHGRDAYTVTYEFEVRVPADTKLLLATVNHGEIKVENTTGDYDLDNINGGVELKDVSGSGRAYALNGALKATFRQNPKGNSYFGSLNGPVDLYFQPNLSADLRFKTFNGGIYTDFPMTALPAQPVAGKRENGKFIYRSNGFSGGRVGQGGPEIKLDGFNGDIRVHRAGRSM